MVSSKNGPSKGSGLSNTARTSNFPLTSSPSTATSAPGTKRSSTTGSGQSPRMARIRAAAAQAGAAAARIRAILGDCPEPVVVERFVPGAEVAVEGLLVNGKLEVLAVFDKPDPLDGPFFEETIYVTPSRQPRAVITEIETTASQAAAALGLCE